MDCCEWGGVTCDHTGRVVGLDLSNESISGGIHNSSSLFSLKYLQSLNLAKNFFSSSEISSGFEKITRLTYLNLSSTNLMGRFPIGISHLTRLVSLDLSRNRFLELGNSNLKLLVQNLTKITELRLDGVNISSMGEEWCQAISSSLPNLQVLSLSRCHLSGPLCSSLENLRSLSVINLSGNNLSAQFQISLQTSDRIISWILICKEHFRKTSSTYQLYVHLLFTGPIPSSFANLTQLVLLDLAYNMFTGPIPSFSKNISIIYLDHNSLSGTIPSLLLNIPSLTQIDLSFNKFDGQVDEISNASSSLLEILNLRNNNLQGSFPCLSLSSEGLLNLLKSFPDLKNQSLLIELDLSDNQLEGEIPNWIWEVSNGGLLVRNIGLAYLNFSHSLFSGLQEPYVSHTYLAFFDIHSNQFHGEVPIPGVLAEFMDFSSNSFSTSIPNMIGSFLANAYFLSLSNNSIIGNIPQSICNMRLIEVLDLFENHLNGMIPSCLIKSGRFPCFLENISSLHVLVLHSNRFQGDINCQGKNNESWWNLQIIDLAFNNFGGDLPSRYFSNWKAMMIDNDNVQPKLNNLGHAFRYDSGYDSRYYSSRVNVIYKGNEVEWVKILTIFTCIDFSSNIFDGKIPDTVGNLKSLVLLNFSMAQFQHH
ncbi:probable LRR receptor-like serine/threonine-protein kinase At4g36180 [Cornus florida]|uniref:probable LRR receptor-like serine/threonine-protein kinase At4g36180 n=1 Tax=Cornus florida TaxID=4283 RepID=UPI00289BD453|nr:probable LRR receptor-like serine/threonine-protein kinase At4g36180 [Cornus florida]